VLLPLRFSRQRWARANAEPGGAQGAAGRLLEALGLSLHTLAGRTVAQLSVGQQQRVAAARALLGGPRLVLADEPTSALDPENRDAFLKQLEALQRAEGCALLCVSHDPALAPFFDRTVALKAGPGALGP
jgi:ABC-type antimicrobial peptide transport system, ATPase component